MRRGERSHQGRQTEAPRPSQSSLQKPNEEGCQKGSDPPPSASMLTAGGGAKHHLELHHPPFLVGPVYRLATYFLSIIHQAGLFIYWKRLVPVTKP